MDFRRLKTKIVIREAMLSDSKSICEIYNDAVLKTTANSEYKPRPLSRQREIMRAYGKSHPFLLAEQDGVVQGWACLSPWSDRCGYKQTAENSVYIAEAARGRGIGKKLMRALLKEARKRRFYTIIARIVAGNPGSERLHRA